MSNETTKDVEFQFVNTLSLEKKIKSSNGAAIYTLGWAIFVSQCITKMIMWTHDLRKIKIGTPRIFAPRLLLIWNKRPGANSMIYGSSVAS